MRKKRAGETWRRLDDLAYGEKIALKALCAEEEPRSLWPKAAGETTFLVLPRGSSREPFFRPTRGSEKPPFFLGGCGRIGWREMTCHRPRRGDTRQPRRRAAAALGTG